MTVSTAPAVALDLDSCPVIRGVSGSFRVYFYDMRTRREFSADHVLGGGLHWAGTGAMVSHGTRYVDGTADVVCVYVWHNGGYREVRVTADMFGPDARIAFKVWCKGHENDWRMLAKGDGSHVPAANCKRERRIGKEWAEGWKAGINA